MPSSRKRYEKILHGATRGCDTETVKSILGKCDLNAVDEEGRTALYVACSKGFLDIARLLLDNGADINFQRRERRNNAAYPLNFDAIRLSNNWTGFTALHIAAMHGTVETVKLLLRTGADVHLVARGYNALHLSCRNGHWAVAEELLDHGADIDAIASLYEHLMPGEGTALHLAAEEGWEDTVRLLLNRRASIDVVNMSGETALHLSCRNGHLKVAELLVRSGACVKTTATSGFFKGFTALHAAAWRGVAETVALLLDSKADVDAASWVGMTPLHCACDGGYPYIAERLLQHGARVDAAMSGTPPSTMLYYATGYTPLHFAAYCEHASAGVQLQLIELLLEWGADVNAEDGHGKTPFVARLDEDDGERTVVEIFAKHFVKMRAQNLFLSAANVQVFSHEATTDLCRRCQNEIDALRRRTIAGTRVNLFDVLTRGTRRLADCMQNDGLMDALKDLQSSCLETEFPIYASLIRCKIRRAREKRDLQRRSDSVLRLSDLRYVPYLCIKRINRYLTNGDLTKVILAKPSSS